MSRVFTSSSALLTTKEADEVTTIRANGSVRIGSRELDLVIESGSKVELCTKDGGCKWILDRGIGVRDADGVVSKLVGTLSDVTPRKLAEIEVRRSRDQAEEALEQQVATSEILRVISRSPTDTQPIFDAIVQSAVRLCDAVHSAARLQGDAARGDLRVAVAA